MKSNTQYKFSLQDSSATVEIQDKETVRLDEKVFNTILCAAITYNIKSGVEEWLV